VSGASHRRRSPEATIQRAVFAHLRARGAPGLFAFHPANGGYRKPAEAAIMKGLGVVPGVPDIIAIHQGRCYAMELKAEGGRPTETQLAVVAAKTPPGHHRRPSPLFLGSVEMRDGRLLSLVVG
jgi:hypothetical protein